MYKYSPNHHRENKGQTEGRSESLLKVKLWRVRVCVHVCLMKVSD